MKKNKLRAVYLEYLRLTYHGYKVKDKTFNADFETHFDPNLPKVHVIPQDFGREYCEHNQ